MIKTKKALIAALLLLALSITFGQRIWYVQAETQLEEQPSLQLIAAIPRSFPPQYGVDDQGQPYGFAIDVMNAVAAEA
jgi:ABC-type amino acid transport substrate-binding protein